MASSSTLEDHITCSVCFEIYRDPHALKCLHSYCLDCINQIQRGGTIICPECREPSHVRDIKDDFKIQGFIDLFKEQQKAQRVSSSAELFRQISDEKSSSKQGNTATCQVCQESDKEIHSKCVECKQFMCRNCAEAHTGISTCAKHRVSSIKSVIKLAQRDLRNTIVELENDKSGFVSKSKEVQEEIDAVRECQKKQVDEVNKFTDELIEELNQYRKGLNRLINSANDNYVKGLNVKKQCFDDSQKSVQEKIDLLAQLVISEDVSTLSETARTIEKSVKAEVGVLKSRLPPFEPVPHNKSPVSIVKGPKLDPHHLISVRIGKDLDHHPSRDRVSSEAASFPSIHQFENILRSRFLCERSVGISFYPMRCCFIEDNIWVAGWDGIYVFNQNCQMLKTIQHSQLKRVRGLVQTTKTDVIACCAGFNGLIKLDISGRVLGQIISGNFTDISYYKGHLYALDTAAGKILVFKYMFNKKWEEVKEFNKVEGCDRISVNSNALYVSSSTYCCLMVYNLAGQLIYNSNEDTDNTMIIGSLKHPLLCTANSEGDILISDYGNHRLKVRLQRGGRWRVMQLPGDVSCPVDALADQQGEYVWMIKQHPSQLLKFSHKTRRSSRTTHASAPAAPLTGINTSV